MEENFKPGSVRTGWLVFLAALGLRLLAVSYFDYSLDDAYITYRVASNIAEGHGMVYNQGERVMAVTTPLYTLLMVPGELTGMGAPMLSKLMNSLFAAGSCLLLYLLLRDRSERMTVLAAVLSLLLSPLSIFITLTGMESALFAFLLLLSTFLYRRQKWISLGFTLGAISLTRPEGFLFAAAVWICLLAYNRKGLFRTTLPLAVISLAWLVFATVYYGSVVPNSYIAKKAYFQMHPMTGLGNLRSYARFFSASLPLFWAAPVFIVWGGIRALKRERDLLPLALWIPVVMALQIRSDIYISFWYMHMLLPPLLLFLFTGFQGMMNALPGKVSAFARTRASIIPAVIIALSMLVFVRPWITEERDMRLLDRQMGQLGGWFRENSIPTDRVVGIEAVGRVGYESGLRVLDRMGLCSPEVIPHMLELADYDIPMMNRFKPDYFITGLTLSEDEVPGYFPVAAFPVQRVSRASSGSAVMNDTTFIYGLTR